MIESKSLLALCILVCTVVFFGSTFLPMSTTNHIVIMCVFGFFNVCLIGLGILEELHKKNKI
jgi:hypothetical protein